MTDGIGLSKTAPVFIDFHFIESIQFINSFPYFQLTPKRTIAFPQTPEFEKISSMLKNKVIFDGRNVYDRGQMKELGFFYESVGREAVK